MTYQYQYQYWSPYVRMYFIRALMALSAKMSIMCDKSRVVWPFSHRFHVLPAF